MSSNDFYLQKPTTNFITAWKQLFWKVLFCAVFAALFAALFL